MSALSPTMEKQRASHFEATPNRWLVSKLLSAALLLFLSLSLWTLDSSPPSPPLHLNLYLGTYSISTPPPQPPKSAVLNWISVPMPSNFTSTFLSRWLSPGGEPCRDSPTANISLPALDSVSAAAPFIVLPAAEIHRFTFSALDASGRPRCLGGDYFETDLSGASWKSRPPITDHGNGSYSFDLQVHPDAAGEFQLTIVLLFRSFQGLKFSPKRFAYLKQVRSIQITFRRSNAGALPDLQVCRRADFAKEIWSGRWTRHGGKDEPCEIDDEGRYRCLAPNFPCKKPWCDGPLGALESNGWVYSAHCSFKIFSQDSAWRCLRNKWLFFWGDSNHVDTIRNMLNFILGRPEIPAVPRRFDRRFTNPRNASESVRITSVFNGHWNETGNYLGVQSLRNDEFKKLLWKYFSSSEEDRVPDAVILNSGLHDGVYWKSIRAFAEGAEYAAKFWEEVMRHIVEARGKKMPRVFYRTTIATGGYARELAFNPSKMEAFNGVLLEKLKEKGLLSGGGVIDQFDMTFPWHYDNRCNDGVHYGRAPAKLRWTDGEVGHQYFVDLMLGHVLLNAICNE